MMEASSSNLTVSDPNASPARAIWFLWAFATLAVLGWILAPISLSLQFHTGVQDTIDWAWVPFLVIGCLGSVLLIPMPLLVPAHRRLSAAVLGMVGTTLPLVVTILFVFYLFDAHKRRHLPDNEIHRIGRMAAVTVLRWYAHLAYPLVRTNDRFIMHHDQNVPDPDGDLVRMTSHLKELERRTGRLQTLPIRWVRGSALGLEKLCVNNLALGSDSGPSRSLDRHELAHAFSFQFWDRRHQPPTMLIEGFAMAADKESLELAQLAKQSRVVFAIWRQNQDILPVMFGPEFYHSLNPFAYDFGGSFVDFLLRRHGSEKLIQLFNRSTPSGIERQCQEILGRNLAELETEWWADVEALTKKE